VRVIQPEYGAVIEHFSVVIAPTQVSALSNFEFADILDHDAR
jgi:hypothetical protein